MGRIDFQLSSEEVDMIKDGTYEPLSGTESG